MKESESEVSKIEESESKVLKIEKSESEVLKIEESESELLCTKSTAPVYRHLNVRQPYYPISKYICTH
jgi:hypothetical protein